MLLTPKKLQGHSEAEEGVSVGHFKDRKNAGLQTHTYTETTASARKHQRNTSFSTEQYTKELPKRTAATTETLVLVDRRGSPTKKRLD
jgi:hypothetical protein